MALCLDKGCRSSVYVDDDGVSVYRLFHDTGTFKPLTNRPAHRSAPKPYLERAAQCMFGCEGDIDKFARRCGVVRSTAWSYACQVAESWPDLAGEVKKFVHPPLWAALAECPTTAGSLKSVMECLEQGPMRGDQDWRCVQDRYAHLRLARVCLSV